MPKTKTAKTIAKRIPFDRMGLPGDYENLDLTPIEMPLHAQKPMSLQEEMARFIRAEISDQSAANGRDTFAEDDDFEEEDPDTLNLSQYEMEEIQEEYVEIPPDAPQAPQEAHLPEELASEKTEPETTSPDSQAPQEKTTD